MPLSPPGDAVAQTLPCAAAIESETWAAALVSCADELARRGEPTIALHLGRARLETGDVVGARELSAPLLDAESLVAADANQLFGKSLRDGKPERAKPYFERALRLHQAGGRTFEAARDVHLLAGLARTQGEYFEALELLDQAAALAKAGGNRRVSFYASLGRGDVLRLVGDYGEAEHVLEGAWRAATCARERMWASHALGLLHLERGADMLAKPLLQRALDLATELSDRRVSDAVALSFAWLARRAGELDEADRWLDKVPRDDDTPIALAFNRGLIAATRGDFVRARGEFERAEKADPENDWAWLVSTYLGRFEEALGHKAAAEAAYRRALVSAAALREGAGRQLAAHVLATRRLPHERLVGLLASEERWHDVLGVVDTLDLGAVLATDTPSSEVLPTGAPLPPQGAHRTFLRPSWSGADTSGASAAGPLDLEPLLEAWRGRHLVVLIPGGDDVVRLEIYDGKLSGTTIGRRAELEGQARRLEANLDDVEAARALGEAMVPPARGDGPVELLIVGPLGRVPIAALRHGEALVVASTPLVRVLGLRAPRAPSPPGSGRVVLGDPRGDLPSAADEARWVARRVGTEARLGPDAGRDALAAGRDADLLHVAAHAVEGSEGAALRLADGDVGALDVAALTPAARVVVLASCASAASRDETGWGSLAAAFVVAGAETVVATQWSVVDTDATRIVKELYNDAPRMLADPARALAAAQARLASEAPARAWAAFTAVRAAPTVGGAGQH